jgi:hypothetical protein
MVQNHLSQILTLLAMETPPVFEAEAIRDEKVKVLKSVAPLDPQRVVFGQYVGYRQEPGVAKNSRTETAVELKMEIANWDGEASRSICGRENGWVAASEKSLFGNARPPGVRSTAGR